MFLVVVALFLGYLIVVVHINFYQLIRYFGVVSKLFMFFFSCKLVGNKRELRFEHPTFSMFCYTSKSFFVRYFIHVFYVCEIS